MKEIQDTVNEISKLDKGESSEWLTKLNRGIWLDSIKFKAQFVINYIERIEQEHLIELKELERDMQFFRDPVEIYQEANDVRGEMDV
jgi:hypothetical protein